MKRIAIFASGTGTNALKIIQHFQHVENAQISLIVSNKKTAPVLQIAEDNGIEQLVINREKFYSENSIVEDLKNCQIDFIVLAGFLWLVPMAIIDTFSKKIINIHPSLLPKYGGKGMYGMNVHRAVHEAKEKESGITIHYVNRLYDDGAIIFQEKIVVTDDDSPNSIAQKIRVLEHKHFPVIVEALVVRE